MGDSTKDNFPVAAVRHFYDAVLLMNHSRFDNAMCHFAFAAECAIKTLYKIHYEDNPKHLGHNMEKAWEDIKLCYTIMELMDADAGEWMGRLQVPECLFRDHPQRRYEGDIQYSDGELQQSEFFVQKLIDKIITYALDGRWAM